MPKGRKLTPSAKPSDLFEDIRALIEQARAATARAINSAVTLLYWQVGQRIRRDVLHEQRAEYGEQIVATLSRQLTDEFGRGWNKAALTRMMQFAERFSDPKIVATLSQQLTWSHVVELLPLKDSLQRDFYAEMCRLENWSVRTLRAKIDGMLFERTGLSRKPAELAKQELRALRDEDRLTPDLVFRDPYVLDFLGLHDSYSERELEAAILREIESFLLELGNGFAFIARQKRIRVDDEDFYIDLLLYHRKLRGPQAGENSARSMPGKWSFTCAGWRRLMELGKSSIRVAEYLTVLPPRDLLAKKLHEAIRQAQARMLPESPPPPQTA